MPHRRWDIRIRDILSAIAKIQLNLIGHSLVTHGNGWTGYIAEVLPQFFSAQLGEFFLRDRWSRLEHDFSFSPW